MRIAIIGAGASGLITAWLLQKKHRVEIFERAPIPGGHVRTLNRNVTGVNLPSHVCIENGVLGFHRASYPNFIRLMELLNVPLQDDRPYARLYTGRSQYPVGTKTLIRHMKPSNVLHRVNDLLTVYRMVDAYKKFDGSLDAFLASTPKDTPTGPLLSKQRTLNTLQRAILMLSYSTPYEEVETLPVGLTLPYLASLRHREWCYVEGGVYHYIEKLLANFKGVLHTGVQIIKVVRNRTAVDLLFLNGDRRAFDKVIFAVSPGQIIRLLDNPSEAERTMFMPWRDRLFETVAHTDDQIYNTYDKVTRTPMDLFVDPERNLTGYNTSMNRAYRLPDQPAYAFAYNLESRIDPGKILDRQAHVVPVFTGEALLTRQAIVNAQGENHCYYTGAWLGNGLHEGAVSSALDVALKFGVTW